MSTDPVCEFYSRHPYPPPVDNLDRARDEWRDPVRHRAEFHLFWPDRPFRPNLDILIAGCGTWQAAKHAVCRPEARVTGIDVSPTSIECTEKLARQYHLTNLDIRQLPIERIGELGRSFDLIVCTGVLHHLADPEAGLRALRAALRPTGAIYVMVYAAYGRIGVYMLQDYCRRLGIGTSDEEIRDLAATLEALPQHHPVVSLLRGSRDARNPDALADTLLNPRDRAYSVPQVFDLLDRTGLTLARWYWQAPYLPQCGAIANTPHAGRLAALPERDRYAAMELWRGMMTAHSAIVYPAGPRDARASGVQSERGLASVPLRLPWTQLIVDRGPAGAAGVVLNRSHAFTDLVLPLDADQRRMFERIDGRRTVAEIANLAAGVDEREARTFFDTLWSYDQVVFDTSA